MGVRAHRLAEQFELANQEFLELIDSLTHEDWMVFCPPERRRVGIVAHHVAYDYAAVTSMLRALAAGKSRPITAEQLDERNAQHAEQYANCNKDETIKLLREDGRKAAAAIRELDDELLGAVHDIPFMSQQPVTLEQFIHVSFIDHHAEHVSSIRSALRLPSRRGTHQRTY
jgi:hypothetical protein